MIVIGHRTIKTAIGSAVAMIIAYRLHLEYYTAAGVITILSVQSTRRQSLQIAFSRFLATLIALTLATVLFHLLGYSPLVFGLIILFFIPLTVVFKATDGIVVNSVLVTHLLVEETTSLSLLTNEVLLMLVGVGVALIINLYMPSLETDFKKLQEEFEINLKQVIIQMAKSLRGRYVSIHEEKLYTVLEDQLQSMQKVSLKISGNKVFKNETYYKDYVSMRMKQLAYMRRMREHFERLSISYEQTLMLSKFTEQVALSIYEENNASLLLEHLDILNNRFKEMPLPATREEFENRAMLLQFMNEMESFLRVKNDFIESRPV